MLIYELSLATVVCINIILAVGLNLITGYCGQISLGHAAFYGIGAYTTALMAKAGIPGIEIVGGQIDEVTGKRCTLACFPIRYRGGEASLVRLVAIVDE